MTPLFQKIMFTPNPGVDVFSRTKNGHVKTSGIELYAGAEEVQISPIRINGEVAKGCSVGIARDAATLRALAQALKNLANELEAQP